MEFKRILLATDFSPASVAAGRVALELASELGAALCLLHIAEPPMLGPGQAGLAGEIDAGYQRAEASLLELQATATELGLTCEAHLAHGPAAPGILAAMSKYKASLAVLGTRALRGLERLCFGSTAEAVLRQAECPVITVGPRAAALLGSTLPVGLAPSGPVVFATDFDPATMDAIRFASTMCAATHSPLHCLHVLPRSLESAPDQHAMKQILTEALHQVARESGAVLPFPVCATSYASEVSNAVVEYADRQHARMLVLGVRQASMLHSHLPPHVAYRIITESTCPVLTMAFGPELVEKHRHSHLDAVGSRDSASV